MPSITASNRRKNVAPPASPKKGSCASRRGTTPACCKSSSPDDGRGVDLESLRAAVVERGLTNAETAAQLSEAELLEFLFLPGFTMKETVTEISGRGVGLDVVQEMVKQVRGTVRVSSEPGNGTRFQMQLPLTLSVLRTMLVNIDGEPYAFPLAHLERTLKIPRDRIELLEGRQYFHLDGRQIGLASAHQILEVDEPELSGDISVIVVGAMTTPTAWSWIVFSVSASWSSSRSTRALGKIKNITAGALMENGLPVLIVDVEDMILSLEKLAAAGSLNKVRGEASADEKRHRKRVLVVDDSLTVRELERKLLSNRGYEVEIAVDGMDGWNAVRTEPVRSGRHGYRYAAHGRHRAGDAHQEARQPEIAARDGRFLQGPRRRPPARPRAPARTTT